MNRQIFDRQYWYNYVDIDILLKSKCENRYFVWDSTSQDVKQFSKTINDVCKKLKNNKECINTIVIPINIGYLNNGKYKGSHWVGLVIKMDSSNTFEVFYCDSLGNSLDDSLITVLNSNGIDDIRNFSDRQQHNTFDCGPFLVFNLDSLAKTGCLPLGVNEDAIVGQRLIHKALIESGGEEYKLIDIQDSDNDVIQESISKEEADRNKDVTNLKLIFKAIIDCKTDPLILRSTLITIGELAGEISYNDTGDKENRYIRNRYGYVQRNHNKLINKDGIYFESLYHMKIILSDDEIYSFISIEELNPLRTGLSGLKQKIAYILREQNESIDDTNGDFFASIEGLTNFSRKYYDTLLIKQVKQELEDWEQVDFSIKDDRYYLARVLCKIGEFLNELLVNLSIEDKKQVVIAALKCFVELRDQFIHHRDKIRFGLEPDESHLINALIVDIKCHLKQIIVIKPNNDENNHWPQFQIDRGYTEAREFFGAVDQFLSHIIGKKLIADENLPDKMTKAERRKEKTVKQLTNEDMIEKVHRLVIRACDLIKADGIADPREKTRGKSAKSKEDQMKHYDVEYQSYFQKLGDKINRQHYPSVLSLDNTDAINKCASEIVPAPNTQAALPNKEMENKLRENVELFHLRLDEIKEEVEYILALSGDGSEQFITKIFQKRYRYVFQHSMLVIGQLMRDIEILKICMDLSRMEDSDNSVLPYLNKFKSSILLIEGRVASKQSRNRGLAHNIWNFNEVEFYERLKEVLSAFAHLESFCEVMKKNKSVMSVEKLHNIGASYAEIGLYNEAVDYTEKAIDRSKLYPHEAQVLNPDESSDEFKIVFEMERPVYRLYRHLATHCICASRLKQAYEVLEYLRKKINFDKSKKYSTSMLEEISSIYCDIHYPLFAQGKLEEAVKILEEAELIFEDFITKVCLAGYYYQNEEYDKAHRMCEKIIKDSPNSLDKFNALTILIDIYLEQSDTKNQISEIEDCVNKMETILQKDLGTFKSIYRDKYLLTKFTIITLKLEWIIEVEYQTLNRTIVKEFEIMKLRYLEKELQDIKRKFNEDLDANDSIIILYLTFCCAFCCIFNERNVHLDSNGENLKKAQHFFDLATNARKKLHVMLLLSLESQFVEVAVTLSKAYNYFAMTNQGLNRKARLDNITKAEDLQEKYHLEKTDTLYCFAFQFQSLGNEYFNMYEQNGRQEFVDLSLANFNDAIKYYSLTLQNQIVEGDAEAINKTKMSLASSYNAIAMLRFELRLIRESISRYEDLLTLPLSETYKSESRKCKVVNEQILSDATRVLNDIVNSRSGCELLSFASHYIMQYCRRRFDIHIVRENGATKWFYRGKLSWDELANQIYQELNISDEMLLLYRFYKVLLSKGFLTNT